MAVRDLTNCANLAHDNKIRWVAGQLTTEELQNYDGPIHCISHHEIFKAQSKSTPVGIVIF